MLSMEDRRTLDELETALQHLFSIDDYLELRRRFPKNDSPLWMVMGSDSNSPSFGMDFAFQLQGELAKFGIQIDMFLGTLDGDRGHVDLLCLAVLEALSKREKLVRENAHAIASGLAIGDGLVDFLCGTVLECVSYHNFPLPHSFQILLKYRLGLFESAIKEDRVLKHRRIVVALIMAENTGASAREIAKRIGMSPSTVTRWMADEDFMSYVKMFRAHPPR